MSLSGARTGRLRWRAATAVALVGLLAPACSGGGVGPGDGPPGSTDGTGPAPISYDPSGPWVVTAVDYHFHDAHPTPALDPDQPLVFKNAGRNLHNLTIPAADFVADIAPGDEITIDVLGEVLPPGGTYRLVCTIHASEGMEGRIVVAEA